MAISKIKMKIHTILLALLLLSACKTQPGEYGSLNSAVITLETYGGFVPSEMARQELRIEYGKVTYRVFASNGTLTNEIVKPLSQEQFESIVQEFIDADFFSLKDEYNPSTPVADAGTAKMTFSIQGKQKTIIIDPYYFDEAVPNSLKQINEQLISMITFAQETSGEDAKKIAEQWIINSPTYKHDGFDLALIGQTELEIFPVLHQLVYTFNSKPAGYGDRTGQITAQVITPHNITITVVSGKATSAVIDGKWDEISQSLIAPSEIEMAFDLMQCIDTPWAEWLKGTDIKFVKEPTESQIAIMYFGEKGIEVKNFRNQTYNIVTCQACGVCWSGKRYFVTVSENDVDAMIRLGWKTNPDTPVTNQ